MTDQEHAAAIKDAVDTLNEAIRLAAKDGIEVEIGDVGKSEIGVPVGYYPFFTCIARRVIA